MRITRDSEILPLQWESAEPGLLNEHAQRAVGGADVEASFVMYGENMAA